MELRDRERKIDVSKMPKEDVENLSIQIGDKCREICDDAALRINSILSIYGMSAKIAFEINKLQTKEVKKPKSPSKRAKKIKQDNLK